MNTVSQDWGNLLFKLSLAEALEEVATRVTEEAWLYNENAFYFCLDYIHDSNLSSYIRFSKTYPSFLTVKEGSTSHPAPLSSGAREETALLGARNRYALRLADHQRSSPDLRDGTALLFHIFLHISQQSFKSLLSSPNRLCRLLHRLNILLYIWIRFL